VDDEDERRYGEQVRTLEEWDGLDEERVAAYLTTAKSHLLAEAAVIRLIAHFDMTEDLLDLVETEVAQGLDSRTRSAERTARSAPARRRTARRESSARRSRPRLPQRASLASRIR
jgi:hypothetical protein